MPGSIGRVCLAGGLAARLAEEARRAHPREACGALLGTDLPGRRQVTGLMPLRNEGVGGRYAIGPVAVRDAEAAAVTAGLEVVGFYHSHPGDAAEPSTLDLEGAWPWYTYAIVAAATGAIRAWRLADDRSGLAELALELEDGA